MDGPSAPGAAFPEWDEFVEAFRGRGDRALSLAADPDDPRLRQELSQQLLTSLVHGYIGMVYADPEYPEFIPTLGLALNYAAPVPDFMYKGSPIQGDGVYRIWGNRGTSTFVDLNVNGGYWAAGTSAPRLAAYTLDDLTLSPNGDFEVILSNERPAGHTGDWWRLDPAGRRIGGRRACSDWLNETDARLAIERLDRPARRPRRTREEIARRMSDLPRWIDDGVTTWLRHVKRQKAAAPTNDVAVHDFSYIGGAEGQVYMEGAYDLGPDEALLLDTDVPEVCRYWSILVTDELFATLDWMHRFSSLNHRQATLSPDGRFRAVISARDPGAPNWIDVGDYRRGMMQIRWNRASATPKPSFTRLKVDQVWTHLPADTPRVSASERDAQLRLRRKGAQMRQVW